MNKLNQKELTNLIDNLKYGSGNVINKNDRYTLVKPKNTWDTNYSLYDEVNGCVYYIDRDDVYHTEEELNEYGGIMYRDLISLNIDEIIEVSWKTEKVSI